MDLVYNSYFFTEFYEKNGGGNYTEKEKWMPFFITVAEENIRRYNPKTVLDAGCAMGYIVEALRDRGVEAYGIDISEYAIDSVREDIKPYCRVHSIIEPLPLEFPQKFDLILTIEVLEHLFPEDGEKAIENLCRYTDMIIFSSTPDDIEDRTHVNVQLIEYWARLFSIHSFYREVSASLDFICPWAKLFVRKDDIGKVIFDYELNLRIKELEQKLCLTESFNVGKMKIYYDNGNGFDEDNTIISEDLNYDNIEWKVDLPKNVISIRIDPVENKFCIVKNLQVSTDRGLLLNTWMNGYTSNEFDVFANNDPQYCYNLDGLGIDRIKITASIYIAEDINKKSLIFNTENNLKKIDSLQLKIMSLNDELKKESTDLKEKENVLKELNNQLEESKHKIQNLDKMIAEKNRLVLENSMEIQSLERKVCELEEQKEVVHQFLLESENRYAEISNAFFWRITKPARVGVDYLKSLKKKERNEYTLKKTIKNVVKRILPQYMLSKVSTKIKPEYRYNVEYVKYTGNILEISGWFFVNEISNMPIELEVQVGKNFYSIDCVYGQTRTDVAIAFGNEYINSGFFGKIRIENCNEVRISIVYANDTKKVFIKKIEIPNYIEGGEIIVESALINKKINLKKWLLENVTTQCIFDEKIYTDTIDIIIPIYNGYAFFQNLFQSIEKTKMNYRLILINDKSSDARVSAFLKHYEEEHNNVILLENESNLGFVKSVNRALQVSKNHVALVNTDVELPELWLERLMMPIILNDNIASSTPFTNCGTICSFPDFCRDNELFEKMTVNEIDIEFSKIIHPVHVFF